MLFKNWPEISKIQDKHFMWAMALLDLNTQFGQDMAKRFPEYFSETEQQGPVPFSVIILQAEKNAEKERNMTLQPRDHLASFNAPQDFKIPVFEFSTGDPAETGYPPLPVGLSGAENAKPTEIYNWNRKKIMVIENSDGIYFVPAECILLD